MTNDQFEKLAQLINESHEDLSARMDAGFAAISAELQDIRMELRDIKDRIRDLEEQGARQAGYAKEIDHILERLGTIEKHLALKVR